MGKRAPKKDGKRKESEDVENKPSG